MADISEIKELARLLNLMNVANGRIDLSKETISNQDYLCGILKQEVELRAKKKADAIYKGSRLPNRLFDETRITSGLRWQLQEIRKIDFNNTRQNILVVGECATGKTALAAMIAKEAIEKGASAIYTTEEDLILSARKQKVHWRNIMHSDLIVLDELFYLKPSEENMQYLYRTVMFLQETRSFIFITNRSLSEWDSMGVDNHTVSTFRQRILSGAQIIHLG